MEKTVLNVKTDKSLKAKAQEVARDLGLPLGTIINHYLRELVAERRVVFSLHPMPNEKTKELLKKASQDYKGNKNIFPGFQSAKDMDAYLDALE